MSAEWARSNTEDTGLSAEQVKGFDVFVSENEPRLRQSLTAALGADVSRDATAEALAYAWEHWARVGEMENPAGYLYRVGLNWGRRSLKTRSVVFPAVVSDGSVWFEPGLADALAGLSEKQRVVVYLVHGHDWSMAEVSDLLGVSKGTVQKHVERGMARLRRQMKVET